MNKENAGVPGIVRCGGENQPVIVSFAAVGGSKEKEGPLGDRLDFHDPSDKFGQKTFENAESEMQHIALSLAFKKSGWQPDSVNALFAGDLMNQCTASAYGLLSYDIPYFAFTAPAPPRRRDCASLPCFCRAGSTGGSASWCPLTTRPPSGSSAFRWSTARSVPPPLSGR